MSAQRVVFPALALLLAGVTQAVGCDPATMRQLDRYTQRVASLRVEKPGMARVYAADGTAFTGAQALWMQGQVRAVGNACARGDDPGAQSRLAGLRELLERR
jgi:hypothetical protein